MIHSTVRVDSLPHRKWNEIKQQPGTAGPGNLLGCCLIYFHFRWGKLFTLTVFISKVLYKNITTDRTPHSVHLWTFQARGVYCNYLDSYPHCRCRPGCSRRPRGGKMSTATTDGRGTAITTTARPLAAITKRQYHGSSRQRKRKGEK